MNTLDLTVDQGKRPRLFVCFCCRFKIYMCMRDSSEVSNAVTRQCTFTSFIMLT